MPSEIAHLLYWLAAVLIVVVSAALGVLLGYLRCWRTSAARPPCATCCSLPRTDMDTQSPDWIADCLHWRGRVLTGRFSHWCFEWDGLPIDETTPEWPRSCAAELEAALTAP